MRLHRGGAVGVAVLSMVLVAGACGGGGGSKAKGTLTVGSASFSESTILADIYAKALQAKGYTVHTRLNIGSREVYEPALERGEVSLFPEYAATLLEFVNHAANEATGDAQATTAKLRTRLQPKGLTALDPSPAIDANAFAVRMSRRPFSTNAGVLVMESSTRCTAGRTCCWVGRRCSGRAGLAVRSRSTRCARSASSSCSACVMPSITLSETPVAVPRSSRV